MPVVEEPLKIAGPANPADIGTRGRASLEDIGPASLWQLGPDFLCLEREQWDLEIPDEVSGAVPESEVRQRVLVHAVEADVQGKLQEVLAQVLRARSKLSTVLGILSRVLSAMGSGHGGEDVQTVLALRRHPTPVVCGPCTQPGM